jgi:RecA-family ATPase
MPHVRIPEEKRTYTGVPKIVQEYFDIPSTVGVRNDRLMRAACQLRDMGQPQDQVERDLMPYANSRDGLPEPEVRSTVASVFTKPARDVPHGTKGGAWPRPMRAVTGTPATPDVEVVKRDYKLDPALPLPPPLEGEGAVSLLQALFKPHEHVQIIRAVLNDEGKETISIEHQTSLPVTKWIEVLARRGGPTGIYRDSASTPHGLYYCINPLPKDSRRRKESLAAYRHILVEFDHIPKTEQYQLIIQSRIPCAAIVDSGGKSIHAIVKVDASDLRQAEQRASALMEHFKDYGVDTQCRDPSRLSRFVDVVREDTGGEQKLLALNVGCKSYEEWEEELVVERDGLPAIEDMSDLIADIVSGKLTEPAEVIKGVAHESCKLVLGGGSKTRKTWVLADLAVSVMTGGDWFGRLTCNKGAVLYLNMELPRFFMAKRVQAIAAAKGVTIERGMFKVMNLRGFAASLSTLRPKLEHAIGEMAFKLIILDPTYKLMPGGDENGTSDSSILLNEIERLAVRSGALCAFASHYSKGNQASKKKEDRISGSGVFARDPDTIITMTEHVEDLALSIEFILRNHPPQPSFVISWEHPLFVVDPDLNPEDLKEEKKKAVPVSTEKMIHYSPSRMERARKATVPGISQNDLVDELRKIFDVSDKLVRERVLPKLETMGLEIDKTKKSYSFSWKSEPTKPVETDEPDPF